MSAARRVSASVYQTDECLYMVVSNLKARQLRSGLLKIGAVRSPLASGARDDLRAPRQRQLGRRVRSRG